LGNKVFDSIPTVSPIVNEAAVSNTQGTISMARTSAPNSATSQWFFNLANNSVLDANSSNAGYAVFGQVIRGMDVLYVMESLLRINFFDSTPRGPFGEFPLYRYDEGTNPQQSNPVLDRNVVEIYRAYVLAETFNINAGLSGAWFNPDTVGQGIYFEVLPSVDTLIMAWFTHDTELPGDAVPSTIGAAGNRWITASGNYQGDQFIGKIYVTTGGLFNDPTAVTFIEVGEVIITFSSCGEAVMSFVLEDSEISDSINIQRISGANIALCEQLSIAADQGVSTQ
jgi:cyclophilin family peptidyl-prolyl cis-trans isomerase